MFYYLNGMIAEILPNLVVIDCGGVGFACHTTAYTISQLTPGAQTRLYTYCNIREDAFDVFGFSTKEEKNCFELLLSVTGVGPKAALAILSTASPTRFTLSIATGDEKALTAAPGVGKKLAQRIILELKDKLSSQQISAASEDGGFPVPQAGSREEEAAQALSALGYSSQEIRQAFKGADTASMTVEDLVRHALRAMVMK